VGLWDTIGDALGRFEAASLIDVFTISILIYLSLLLLKGTTAIALLRGIVMVLVGAVVVLDQATQTTR